MAGLNGGGHRCDNGRCEGGRAGPEHRYSFDAVDDVRFDDARRGALDVDSRFSPSAGPEFTHPNTMGVARGTMMGAPGATDASAASGFTSNGAGRGRPGGIARAAAAQAYNDALSCECNESGRS
jgi:hypothetical protein